MSKRARYRRKRRSRNRVKKPRSLLDRIWQHPRLFLLTVLLVILALGFYSTWQRGLDFDPKALLVRALIYSFVFALVIAISYFLRSRAGRRR